MRLRSVTMMAALAATLSFAMGAEVDIAANGATAAKAAVAPVIGNKADADAAPAAPANAVAVNPDAAADAAEAPAPKSSKEGTPLKGVDVASDSTDYDHCKAFKGKDPGAEVTLCLKNAKAWNDKKSGRIVQTNLVMINTGDVGLCNVTVHMDNIDKEIGDHYPEIIDEWAFDTFPRFGNYYAPQRVTHLGASIPKNKGVPAYSILDTMKACNEADAGLLRRPFKCSESNRNGGSIKICVYSDLKAWTDDESGKRMVGVEGFISNVGEKPACNINVNIQDLGKATEVQGEWMPLYKGTLIPKTWLKFGASIPFEEGWPKVSLKKYEVCRATGGDDDEEDEEEDAPAKPAKKPALRYV